MTQHEMSEGEKCSILYIPKAPGYMSETIEKDTGECDDSD